MRRPALLALIAAVCAAPLAWAEADDSTPAPKAKAEAAEPIDEEAGSDEIDEAEDHADDSAAEALEADEAAEDEAENDGSWADSEAEDDEAGGVFVHEEGSAVYGFFAPVINDAGAAPAVGDLMLDHFHLGDDADLAAWEAGERLSDVYAPVMFEFADTASERVENELGAVVFIDRPRALPSAYAVTAETISFVGALPDGTAVTFEGRFDREALALAIADGASADPAIVGDLAIGEATFEDVGFAYWPGD